jgi:hypothetical protein
MGYRVYDATAKTNTLAAAIKTNIASVPGTTYVRWEGIYDGRNVNTDRAPKAA